MADRKIETFTDNQDKRYTYRIQKGRFKRAMEEGFYFEALLIDYALLEDRLRSTLYHMGFLTDRLSGRIWKKKASILCEFVLSYKNDGESDKLGITSITGKAKIIRCVLKWAAYTENDYRHDRYLYALKSQCEGLDIEAFLSKLEALNDWCIYRNEVIHGLMNKNMDSLAVDLKKRVLEGMQLAKYFDKQEKLLKKGNKIRRSANLQTK